MGGHHGKHSESENKDATGSSKTTPRKDPPKQNTTYSAQHGDLTLLVEKKFTLGNKAVKEQFIRDKLLDTSCCATDNSKKTVNKTKVLSNVKREMGIGSPSSNDDIINPTEASVIESRRPQKYECVKSCSPDKRSYIFNKSHCPQTSPDSVQLQSKEAQYLRNTIKSQKRVATRSVTGAIDLIKKTHDQFETILKENETSLKKDSNLNMIKCDSESDVVCESVKVRKEENVGDEGKIVSHLEDETKNTAALKQGGSQATDKKINGSLLTSNKNQAHTEIPKSDVIENAPPGPYSRMRNAKMNQCVDATLRQSEKGEKAVPPEQPTSKNEDCVERKVCTARLLPRKDNGSHSIGRKISRASENHKIQPVTVKEVTEMPTHLTLPNGMSSTSNKATSNKRNAQKASHKNGSNLMKEKVTNKQIPQEKPTAPCTNVEKYESVAHKQIQKELVESKPLTTDPPNPLLNDTRERKVSYNDGELRDPVEPKTGGRIDKTNGSPTKNLKLDGTGNTKLVIDGEEVKGKAAASQKMNDQTSSTSTQTARAESTGQVQSVTKTKMSSRKDNVKGRRKKVLLKPPLAFHNKQDNTLANSAKSQKSIGHGIDSTVGSKHDELGEDNTQALQKTKIANSKGETTVKVNESIMVNGNREKQVGKCGANPEPPASRQSKTTLKSPTKAHPHRSPAGDSNGRMADLNNKRPNVPQELKAACEETQKLKISKPEEDRGTTPKEDPKDVNYIMNDKPDKNYEKHVMVAVDGDAAKIEEKSSNVDSGKKETKRERRKNREKKNKGDDECDRKNQNNEKLESETKKATEAKNVYLVQKIPGPDSSKALPLTETGVPTDKKDAICDISLKKTNLLVYEKEIRTEGDVMIKRKLRKAVRKCPIRKGQPTLMDIRFCQACGDTKQPNGQGLFHCPKCKSVFYCTRACQHNDAKRHKKTCAGVKRIFCKHV